ncbi:hypothetical protein ABZ547_33495 [Streptomyces sparsogenes]|uniref:hypothetical protein n=1 Tax=Streptomyces sparsogenes TaxID=67365 RepID=UPI00340AABA8
MFSNQSRYRALPDVAVLRPDGRTVAAKELRLLPEVTGAFTHTLGDGDRLDQLAFLYYGQPLHYWRICDANPEFLSPLALVGQEPVVTTSYTVSVPDDHPPWARVRAALAATVGVEDVAVRQDVTLTSATRHLGDADVSVVAERSAFAVEVTHNEVAVDSDALAEVIGKNGLTVVSRSASGRTGRQIVIPAAARGQVGP